MSEPNIPSSQEPHGVFAALASIGSALGKGAKAIGVFFGLSVQPTVPSETAMQIRGNAASKKDSWWSAMKCFFGYGSSGSSERLASDDDNERENLFSTGTGRRSQVDADTPRGSEMTTNSRTARHSTATTNERPSEIGRRNLEKLFGPNHSQPHQTPPVSTPSNREDVVDMMTAARRENEQQKAALAREEEQPAPLPQQEVGTIPADQLAAPAPATDEALEKRKAEADTYIAARQAEVAQTREQPKVAVQVPTSASDKTSGARDSLKIVHARILYYIHSNNKLKGLESNAEYATLAEKFEKGISDKTKSIEKSKTDLLALINKLEQLEIASSSSTALSKVAGGFAQLTGYVTGSPKSGRGMLNEQLQSLPYHEQLRAEVEAIQD